MPTRSCCSSNSSSICLRSHRRASRPRRAPLAPKSQFCSGDFRWTPIDFARLFPRVEKVGLSAFQKRYRTHNCFPTFTVVLASREDPYAVPHRWITVSETFCYHEGRGLSVPAFAGTTREDSLGRAPRPSQHSQRLHIGFQDGFLFGALVGVLFAQTHDGAQCLDVVAIALGLGIDGADIVGDC